MYLFMWAISFYVRNACMPNPFEKWVYTLPLTETTIVFAPLIAIALDMFACRVIYVIAYETTGIYYNKYSAPAFVGSFLYLVFYIVHTFLFCLMALFNFAVIPIIGIIVGWFLLQIILHTIIFELRSL